MAGVSRSAITKACRGPLAPACVGKRIDLDHPAAQEYLAKRGVKPTPPRPAERNEPKSGPTSRPEPTSAPDREARRGGGPPPVATVSAEEIEQYAHKSLNELVEMFGTAVAFKDWLDARKKISEIREKDLRNDETEGRLIGREYVRTHVFGLIDRTNRQLLGDSPKTIARRVYSLARSGVPLEEAEGVVRELISSQLRDLRARALTAVRNA